MGVKLGLMLLYVAGALVFSLLPQNVAMTCETEDCVRLSEARFKKQVARLTTLRQLRSQYPETEETIEITELPFDYLLAKLHTRRLNATAVLAAYMAKAINATSRYNCITEFSPNAMAIAEELDNSPTLKGPLHGVPICVNDNHDLQGMDSTLGYSKRLDRRARKSAILVRSLQDMGAVPFCKTNVPQTMVSTGSDNPIFGTTLNPLNEKLSPGSSSGAACLVAAGAVKIASATDMGGCLRLSAHYTGVSAIKTTAGRLSSRGIVPPVPKIVGLAPSTGFLADHPKTLAIVLEGLLSNNRQWSYDSAVVPAPWNSSLIDSDIPLRIGYLTELPVFPPLGDTEKTVLKAKEALEKRGHTLIPFEILDSYEAFDIYSDLLIADGGAGIKEELKDDEIAQSFQTMRFLLSIPYFAKKMLSFLPFPDRMKMVLTSGVDTRRSDKLWDRNYLKNKMREDILKYMEKNSLDLILSPVFPFPAPRVEDAAHLFFGIAYTSIWNLVEFPAGVVKFGIESGTNTTDYNDQGDPLLRIANNNIESSVGMPIGVQVIGKPFQDELVLRAMFELEEAREQPMLNKLGDKAQ